MTGSAEWADTLRSRGHRITPQRQAILSAVIELEHPTAESIHAHLRRDEPSLSLSTVYRNLAVLQECGLITHTHLGSAPPVYHLSGAADHIHLTCLSCGRITSVPRVLAQRFADDARAAVGFVIDPCHAAVYGTCASCTAAAGGAPAAVVP